MQIHYNKHYIQINDQNFVTNGFSDVFYEPTAGDILLGTSTSRHFILFGQVNPPLCDMYGVSLYRWDKGAVCEREAGEIAADQEKAQATAEAAAEQAETEQHVRLITALAERQAKQTPQAEIRQGATA